MSIANKLTYLNDTREKIRGGLNKLGAGILPDDTFRSYADAIEEIYDSMPKVEESDVESATLEGTIKGGLTIDPKGNTSQTGTPTPDAPIPINVVSGDNEIVVCKKNRLDYTQVVKGRLDNNGVIVVDTRTTEITTNNGTITFTTNAGYGGFTSPYIPITPNTDYTFSVGNTTLQAFTIRFSYYDENKNHISQEYQYSTNAKTFNKNAYYFKFSVEATGAVTNGTISNIMLEQSSSATSYEPYIGQSYPINLPVENLFDKDNANLLNAYIYNAKVMPSNNDRTAYLKVNKNTSYCLTIQHLDTNYQPITNDDFNAGCFNEIPQLNLDGDASITMTITKIDNSKATITFTTKENTKYLAFKVCNINKSDLTATLSTIQLEKGSKMNSYTPYGTTPIEMNGIGDNQDYFTKSTGKNLWNKATISNGYINADGTLGSTLSDSYVTSDFIPVIPNETYYQLDRGTPRAKYYNANKELINTTSYQDISIGGVAGSFTIPDGVYFVRMSIYQVTIKNDNMMFNKGSSALPYEPYGTGEWFLRKNIGKKTFIGDASESWSLNTPKQYVTQYVSPPITNAINETETTKKSYTNYFSFKYGNPDDNTQIEYYWKFNTLLVVVIKNTTASTVAELKTWLNTHNVIFYYRLAIPTGQIIPDSLKEQLDAIEAAKSYEGQTNISQNNNDKPFKIDAKAILDWRNNE